VHGLHEQIYKQEWALGIHMGSQKSSIHEWKPRTIASSNWAFKFRKGF